ncbi:MAG: hypothetical protein WCT47_04830 [Betaproteobacteria bacterium]|jgi:hypothetical protein
MDIHQIQVKYDPLADRLLLQIRTRDELLFPIWLTRRMVMRLWPHFRGMVSGLAVTRSAPSAMAVPEARDMLAEAARERALRSADFKTQFDPSSAKQALGPEPMLPTAIDLRPAKGQAVVLVIRDANGRSLELAFGEDLAHGLSRLVESALVASEWGLVAAAAETQTEPGTPSARVLN